MKRHRVGAIALAVAGSLLACGGDDPQPSGAPLAREVRAPAPEREENQPPLVERLALNPPDPLPGQQIEARIEASDPDGDPIRLELEWRQEGRVIFRGAQTTVVPDRLRKGDEIAVVVTATDGSAKSEPVRATLRVGNQPPLVQSLYLEPDGEIAPGQELTAAPRALDADGDALAYEFEWWVNGRKLPDAEGPTLDTSDLKRGDRVQARVRVGDGDDWSPVAESMTLELANRAPRFAGLPEITASEGTFRAALEASDPDGDRSLRYRVMSGPQGLSVDPVSGRLSWRPEATQAGSHPVEVAVADSFGAESAMRFELTVASAAPAPAAPPAKAEPRAADDADREDDEE